MKMLSKDQMKKIVGGVEDGGGANGGCKPDAICSKKEGNTITIGQCYEKDVPIIGCACLCDIIGGSGCGK